MKRRSRKLPLFFRLFNGKGLALGLVSLGLAAPGLAAAGDSPPADPHDVATQAAEWLLGSADEDARLHALLPFARQIGISGTVSGSLAESTAAAGVPAAAMLEALRALGSALDLGRDVKAGDRFYVRYEQKFTLAGQPIDVGRVLWAELRTAAKGTVAVHRFRPRTGPEQFWLPSGKAAAPPEIGVPLDIMTLTSGFGLRTDPLDHPPGPLAGLATPPPPPAAPPPKAEPTPEEKAAAVRDEREIARAAAGFGTNGQLDNRRSEFDAQIDRVMAERRIRARREKEEAEKAAQEAAAKAAAPPPVVEAPPPPPPKLYMHEGLDLLANSGTPVRAAADGMVTAAGPNGGYGNWIRVKHADPSSKSTPVTLYGHLSTFAPGIANGTMVSRGELIGFVGNTGRSTGAHLHFELLVDGRPVDPRSHPLARPAQLAGADLERFRKQVAESQRVRDREAAAR